MKRLAACGICVVAATVILSVMVFAHERSALSEVGHWPATDPVLDLPGDDDDEDCNEPGDGDSDESTDETPGCSITKAEVTLGGSPTLTLEGHFCEDPSVSLGTAGGILEPLPVVASGPTFVEADLAPWTDPATRVVAVECPCATCALDVTIGTIGPAGPSGPPGSQGPPGEIPQGLTVPLVITVPASTHSLLGDGIECFAAECSGARVVTGGGFSVWRYAQDGLEQVLVVDSGFELAAQGPYVLSGVMDVVRLPSNQWIVCGAGADLYLTVYAICADVILPLCGDGEITAPETCETTADCAVFGPDAECVACNCINFCGDGVVTPPEQCDPPNSGSDDIGAPPAEGCGGVVPLCGADCECHSAGDDDPGGGDG